MLNFESIIHSLFHFQLALQVLAVSNIFTLDAVHNLHYIYTVVMSILRSHDCYNISHLFDITFIR